MITKKITDKIIPKSSLIKRIHELILKSLSFELQNKVKQDYSWFNKELALDKSHTKQMNEMSETMMMSAKAFEDEDEQEDFI